MKICVVQKNYLVNSDLKMVGLNNEIESFVLKFQQLWSDCLDANLTLQTHAGNAWVDLKLNLGKVSKIKEKISGIFH